MNTLVNMERTAPQPYSFSRPFWEATRQKKLLIQYCRATGKPQFYPRPTSIFTGKRALEWREVSGEGSLYTYTIANRGPGPFRGYEPYVIANVELDAGVNIIGNLIHCEPDQIVIGMRLRPYWAPLSGGMHLLMFEPNRSS